MCHNWIPIKVLHWIPTGWRNGEAAFWIYIHENMRTANKFLILECVAKNNNKQTLTLKRYSDSRIKTINIDDGWWISVYVRYLSDAVI